MASTKRRRIARAPSEGHRPTSWSSWRWPDDDAFTKWVGPLHVNPVDHVRQSWIARSWVNSLEEFFEAWEAFKGLCDTLEEDVGDRSRREELTEPIHDRLCQLGYYGEIVLLYRQRLAQSDEGMRFIHYKQFIQHEANELGRRSHISEIRRLIEAAQALREKLEIELHTSDDFIVGRIRSLPADLASEFYIARDLYSVGFDEVGLLVVCRGLEQVIRRILVERKINTIDDQDPERAPLARVIDTVISLKWRCNSKAFISSASGQMLHWMRAVRNEGSHVQFMTFPTFR